MPESPSQSAEITRSLDLAEPVPPSPLVLLRDTERSLRLKAVDALAPILPDAIAERLGEASGVAEDSLNTLARIDLTDLSTDELHPARITAGLVLIAIGSLASAFLLLYLYTLHPHLRAGDQIRHYWYQYVWFVCLGVAGLFMVGREAMRPPLEREE